MSQTSSIAVTRRGEGAAMPSKKTVLLLAIVYACSFAFMGAAMLGYGNRETAACGEPAAAAAPAPLLVD